MKYLALLISIYCTLLTVLPCQDLDHIPADNTQITIQKQASPHQRQAEETCPPFCNCNCCSNARQVVSRSVVTFFRQMVICPYPEYSILPIQNQAITIWQPPKISNT